MDRNFVGAGKRLDDLDLPRLGSKIGVGEDEIHAFLDVETRGHGFDSEGRPVILFEPHVFYRNLAGAERDQAVAQGLAYPEWGEKPYPKDSYPRLVAACAINETAALKSASWGLGQVLGENFEAAGFLSPQAMVEGMEADEEIQLEASINFIIHNRLDDNLRAHDWAGFAKGYNGAHYAKNEYDTKLADAYRKWSRIKDTPWPPAAQSATAAPPSPVQDRPAETKGGMHSAPPVITQNPSVSAVPAGEKPPAVTTPASPHHTGLIALLLMLFATAATFFHLGH